MSYAIYDYLQAFCFPNVQPVANYGKPSEPIFEYRSASMTQSQLDQTKREIRDFFAQRRLVYFIDAAATDTYLFLSLSQLVWQYPGRGSSLMSNYLKPYYYVIPISLQKRYGHFFRELLQIKTKPDGKDLLNIIGTKPLDKDDFTLLQNVYSLLDEEYSNDLHSNIILYLPNVDCVLHPGATLYYPSEREQMCKFNKKQLPDSITFSCIHMNDDRCLIYERVSYVARSLIDKSMAR
jgi:hypothetical protein